MMPRVTSIGHAIDITKPIVVSKRIVRASCPETCAAQQAEPGYDVITGKVRQVIVPSLELS